MKFNKTVLATFIALSLTACGSGGGGGSTPTAEKPTNTQVSQAQQSKATNSSSSTTKSNDSSKKVAAEKAEAERIAAEKAAAEKAEAERIAAEKAAAEKAAAEKAEAERIAARKAELKELAKNAGLPENLATTFAESYAKSDEDITAILSQKVKKYELTNLAKQEGLNNVNAETFAANNLDANEETQANNLLKMLVAQKKGVRENRYTDGLTRTNGGTSSSSSSSTVSTPYGSRYVSVQEVRTSGTAIYNQPYSIITADTQTGVRTVNGLSSEINELSNIKIAGLKTKSKALPTEGTATYTGTAFDAKNKGSLSYEVNFAEKTGSGSISGLGVDDISLEQGKISKTGISSTATQGYNSGTYSLDFYGKNAEEIAGRATLEENNIGFGGTRGEIETTTNE